MSQKIIVELPDLFKSFLAEEPMVNPHCEEATQASNQWIINFLGLDGKMVKKVKACDVGLFISMWVPLAPADKLRKVIDWGNWFWIYDDQFDAGDAHTNATLAKEITESLIDGMAEAPSDKPKSKIVQIHDDFFNNVLRNGNKDIADRYRDAQSVFQRSLLAGVAQKKSGVVPTMQEYIAYRRFMIAVRPCLALVEYAHGLEIPLHVFDDPIIEELENVAVDLCFIQNDLISYQCEELGGELHNLVVIGRLHGLSAQEAFDYGANLLEESYKRWDDAIARASSWSGDVQTYGPQYIEVLKYVVKANLYYSFASERYFKKEVGEAIRSTRRIEVLNDSDFWERVGKPMELRRETRRQKAARTTAQDVTCHGM